MIRQSVGQGGQNRQGDVFYVQILLSDWLVRKGQSTIAIDGLCGFKTIEAILGFQKAETRVADGRLDPKGPTISVLQKKHIQALLSGQLMKPINLSYMPLQRISNPSFSSLVDIYLTKLRAGLD